MLSYRHSFHAGNHADVLKHLTLITLLAKLRSKDKPFVFLDTHCGSGLYDLQSDQARKTGEADTGAGRIWQHSSTDPGLQAYLNMLRDFNPGSRLRRYPGSPAIAQSLLRESDRMVLMELHNNEIDLLRTNFHQDGRISIHHRDGFEGIIALTPPVPRRGLVLIDPAYEMKEDYDQVLRVCDRLCQRWPQGIMAIWYPLLGRARDRGSWLRERFAQKKFPDLLSIELLISEQSADLGMHGSGMLIINTPWQVDRQLESSLSALSPLLGGSSYRVQWLHRVGDSGRRTH